MIDEPGRDGARNSFRDRSRVSRPVRPTTPGANGGPARPAGGEPAGVEHDLLDDMMSDLLSDDEVTSSRSQDEARGTGRPTGAGVGVVPSRGGGGHPRGVGSLGRSNPGGNDSARGVVKGDSVRGRDLPHGGVAPMGVRQSQGGGSRMAGGGPVVRQGVTSGMGGGSRPASPAGGARPVRAQGGVVGDGGSSRHSSPERRTAPHGTAGNGDGVAVSGGGEGASRHDAHHGAPVGGVQGGGPSQSGEGHHPYGGGGSVGRPMSGVRPVAPDVRAQGSGGVRAAGSGAGDGRGGVQGSPQEPAVTAGLTVGAGLGSGGFRRDSSGRGDANGAQSRGGVDNGGRSGGVSTGGDSSLGGGESRPEPVGLGTDDVNVLEDRKYVVQYQKPKRPRPKKPVDPDLVGVTDPHILNPENKPFMKGYRPPPKKPGQGLQPLPSDTGEYMRQEFAPDVKFPVRSKAQEADLRHKQRRGETVSGRKKRNPRKKYHRSKITQKDLLVLELIAVSGSATARSVQTILGLKAPKSAPKRLLGLAEMGLIISDIVFLGGKSIYRLKSKGLQVLRDNRSGVDFDNIKVRSARKGARMTERGAHNAMVSYTVARECKLHGFMPAFFVNERWMERNCSGVTLSRDERLVRYREQMLDAYRDLSSGVRDGIMEKYPMLWVPCAKDDEKDKYSSYHQPDLIMRYDVRDKNGRAKSIAYEIELTRKQGSALKKVLRNYAWSGWFAYGEVRYLVVSDSLGRFISECVESVAVEFENRAKREPNPRDRGFFRSGAAFLKDAVKVERIMGMDGKPLELTQVAV